MSAVDDVADRIRRLDETRATKTQQLQQLQHEIRYNAVTGVDERLDSGLSVATLEIKVEAGRNMLFKAGFLSGQRSYVRVTVEVVTSMENEQLKSSTVMEQKMTTKRPVDYSPKWSEGLTFRGLPAALGTLRLDVMQEERIGADEVVGTAILPLSAFQDQRKRERWHVLKKHDKDIISEVLFSCRFQRSPISALELELELLQNQANELHLFLGRHQNLVGLPTPEPRNSRTRKLLQGTEVVPEETPERTASSRFSAVASFPPVMRKREAENNSTSGNVEMQEAPRMKRQRVEPEKQVNSLSDRIANWLLPKAGSAAPTSATKVETDPQNGAFANESAGMSSSQFFPFKQRQATPAPRRPRRTGRSSTSTTPQKTPSALQAIEKWFFTDKDGNPRDMPFGRQAPSY